MFITPLSPIAGQIYYYSDVYCFGSRYREMVHSTRNAAECKCFESRVNQVGFPKMKCTARV